MGNYWRTGSGRVDRRKLDLKTDFFFFLRPILSSSRLEDRLENTSCSSHGTSTTPAPWWWRSPFACCRPCFSSRPRFAFACGLFLSERVRVGFFWEGTLSSEQQALFFAPDLSVSRKPVLSGPRACLSFAVSPPPSRGRPWACSCFLWACPASSFPSLQAARTRLRDFS